MIRKTLRTDRTAFLKILYSNHYPPQAQDANRLNCSENGSRLIFMPQGTGVKTNRLTVYMIKPDFQRIDDIVHPSSRRHLIGEIGLFVFEESHPHPPDWISDFFGRELAADIGIIASSAKGIFIIPLNQAGTITNFAICFGVGRHLLKDGVVEERFGLKVVLNSVDQQSFRSIDKTTLGSVPKHSREEMGRDVSPADFGIDIEQDLISSVTARSRDTRFGKIITGRDALHLSAKVDIRNIIDFLGYCLERYRSLDYRTAFDWIDQIRDVRPGGLEDQLNSSLIEHIHRRQIDKIWMAVPEILDWADISGFRYARPKRPELQDDLDLESFLQILEDHPVQLDGLKNTDIFAISARNNEISHKWPAFRCLYAELGLLGRLFVLNNGRWYEIDQGFTDQVQRDFAGTTDSDIALPDYSGGDELTYNTHAAGNHPSAFCMDTKFIMHGGGHNKIEFCDILTIDKKIIHVKKYGGSSILNHLFAQGVISGELFMSDADFREKLNRILPDAYKLADVHVRPNALEYEIIYAIISKSANPLDIPFFSKVSLRNAKRRLTSYGYSVAKKKISKINRERGRTP